jgi:hypothetical protein
MDYNKISTFNIGAARFLFVPLRREKMGKGKDWSFN